MVSKANCVASAAQVPLPQLTIPRLATYAYYIVEKRVFDGLLRSDSKGRYFNQSIKGKYPYREVS